ncbi:Discoidin, CUB and LCCL domain-containing protein 1 [Collichthys lucidus]|uniref:Discoidin, CUB and LCCL domain-containing protein 1 n=1 Tax=Collichthys lucidus TaxID=240159 RepID=A0A4U5V3S2_COLLU|nr:Discoidin, CUB and LCCL domain-containing protein 1 [Collichthys lucidus]
MLTKCENIRDAVKSLIAGFWITFSVCSVGVHGQEGNGCGHTVLGTESGTLASQNYPGTYPSNTWCKWRLRVPEGRTLRLLFGDFDIESSPGCSNGSLVITDKNGKSSLDLISCLQRGSHFSSQYLSVYCPAGCKNVTGDVWGNSEQGYRDTSVLCKSAVHAGVASDSLGGRVAVNRGRSLTLYEPTFANGILSKMGSLSEKKLLFSKECNNILSVSGLNASSFWAKNSQEHTMYWSSRNMGSSHEIIPWTAGGNDPNPWLELELSDKRTITGIITTGSDMYYIESYILFFSKDRKNWKLYKGALSKEKKVFQAYTDGHLRVRNSLFPPVVARFVRLQPLSWHGQASAQVQVLGCPVAKVTPRSHALPEYATKSPSIKVNMGTQRPGTSPTPTEGPVLVETKLSSSQPVIVAVGVVLALLMCGSCLLAGVWWKRRKKESQMKYTLPTSCQTFQAKSITCPQSELISYPLERNVHDALPSPPLNEETLLVAKQLTQRLNIGLTMPSLLLDRRLDQHSDPPQMRATPPPSPSAITDTPGNLPEYAEPLPPEPEYATPFSEQLSDSHGPLTLAPTAGTRTTTSSHAQYDCPSHRMLSNGYCTPALHASGPTTSQCGLC